jgi:hypothetical protein
MRDNIKISTKQVLGYYEKKQLHPWFDVVCTKFVDSKEVN